MERHLEGNIRHQDECRMSSKPLEFPLLSVLLRNILVHDMASLVQVLLVVVVAAAAVVMVMMIVH